MFSWKFDAQWMLVVLGFSELRMENGKGKVCDFDDLIIHAHTKTTKRAFFLMNLFFCSS